MSLVNFPRCSPTLLQLEGRYTPAVFQVKSLVWDVTKANSVPWCIAQTNVTPGQDTITFDTVALGTNTPVFKVPFDESVEITEGVVLDAGVGPNYATFRDFRPFIFRQEGTVRDSVIIGGVFDQCNVIPANKNATIKDGGAICVFDGNLTVINSRFTDNKAEHGGAIMVEVGSIAPKPVLTIAGDPAMATPDPTNYPEQQGRGVTLFKGNTAESGGAITIKGEGVLQRGWFVENKATATDGGAIEVTRELQAPKFQQGGVLCSPDVQFLRNEAIDNGGGINFNTLDPCSLTGITFTGNKVTGVGSKGGGLATDGGKMALVDCNFYGNSALATGGGIYVSGGTLTATRATFSQNIAPPPGEHWAVAGAGVFVGINCVYI